MDDIFGKNQEEERLITTEPRRRIFLQIPLR